MSFLNRITLIAKIFIFHSRVWLYKKQLPKPAHKKSVKAAGLYKTLYLYISSSYIFIDSCEIFENNNFDNIKSLLHNNSELLNQLTKRRLYILLELAVFNYDVRILVYLLHTIKNSAAIINSNKLLALVNDHRDGAENIPPVMRVLIYYGAYDRKLITQLLGVPATRAIISGIVSVLEKANINPELITEPKTTVNNRVPELMSLACYLRFIMYSPIGFYTKQVEFGRPSAGGDFTTPATATLGAVYAAKFVSLAFAIWKIWTKDQQHKNKEQFIVVEIGGGNGIFAKNFLRGITRRCHENSKYLEFFEDLKYVILEISEKLRSAQAATTKEFADKIEITFADAEQGITDYDYRKSGNRASLIITNELLDAFPPSNTGP